MNAPLNTALLAACATSPRHIALEQPQVPADAVLLMPGYLHDVLYLDLYGTPDDDNGCSVEAVALAGARVDISALFEQPELIKMGWAADKHGVRQRAASRDEGQINRLEWDRSAA